MGFSIFSEHRSARVIGLALGGVTVVAAGIATAAALGAADSKPNNAGRIARITGGDLSASAFSKLTSSMDRSMLMWASRTGPQAGDPMLVQVNNTGVAPTAAPEPVVLKLQNLTSDQAEAWNAANPTFAGANPAAKPFKLNAGGVLDEARAIDCMTAAVYYEAAWETTDGQRAVAQVVLNRMRHPAYPKTVCGVIFQGSQRTTGCQFSFTCDGSMNRTPNAAAWDRSRKVAEAALNGYVMKKVGNATHYHANYVAPYWSPTLLKIGTIGAHIFYRWTGGQGLPGAFGGAYGGSEAAGMQIAALDKFATPAKVELVTPAGAAINEDLPVVEADLAKSAKPGKATTDAPVLAAADVAKDADALVKAEDLDWRGQPRQKGPPRIAIPSSRL